MDEYFEKHADRIEGWLARRYHLVLSVIDRMQREYGIKGGAAEIGVHHGKFFIPLHNMLHADERSVAVDVFEDQHLNTDSSGCGSQETFQANINAHCTRPANAAVLKADSMMLKESDIRAALGGSRARLFSIDGCHTAHHTYNDIGLAVDVLENGGIIFIDDYYSPHWPGVHEATVRYFSEGYRKVAPVMYGFNKLLLTTLAYQPVYFDAFRQDLSGIDNSKCVEMLGYPILSIAH